MNDNECLLANYMRKDETHIVDGKEVCKGTFLTRYVFMDFVDMYTGIFGGDEWDNMFLLMSMGYEEEKPRAPAPGCKIVSLDGSTTLINFKIIDEFELDKVLHSNEDVL